MAQGSPGVSSRVAEMTEADAIAATTTPATTASLSAQLRELGLQPGMTVMVHSSLSRLGFVAGGAQAVVAALINVLGRDGTLAMPTHSTALSDPASWQKPPVPESWWQTLRDEMPAYDPHATPTRQMGAIVECFRHVEGVMRSPHPTVSAAARGPNAQAIVADHELDHGLGESSPQARIYDLDGHVLLLGVTHANNTALHLSEYRAAPSDEPLLTYYSPITVDGQRVWQAFDNIADDDSDFQRLGEDFASTGHETRGPIGIGTARLMRSRDIVDYGVTWMQTHRT